MPQRASTAVSWGGSGGVEPIEVHWCSLLIRRRESLACLWTCMVQVGNVDEARAWGGAGCGMCEMWAASKITAMGESVRWSEPALRARSAGMRRQVRAWSDKNHAWKKVSW